MDVTTHAAVGAFAALGLAKGRPAMKEISAAVFLGSMAPDIDAIFYLVDPRFYFEQHRTLTHTLGGLALLSMVTAGLITVSSKKCALHVLVLYAFVGGLIHLALDALPGYPLRPLTPLSFHDYALGLFWWRDPFFKVTALIGIALILIVPRLLSRPILLVGSVVMAGRVAAAFFLHR
jgi:membrane-bound metal-dependent hydrolase YbcI (DUF457 family)